jgi:hypothetical protein
MSIGSSGGQYEFTEAQNDLIGRLAYKMRGVGVFFAVIGGLYLIFAVLVGVRGYQAYQAGAPTGQHWLNLAILVITGLVYAAIGVWTRQSSADFRKIVDTRGSDITHLMNALESLHKFYSLIYTIILLLLAVLMAGIVMAIIGAMAR